MGNSQQHNETYKQLTDLQAKFEKATKELQEKQKRLADALAPETQKESVFKGNKMKVMLTKGGTVMVSFVDMEQAKIFYNKI